MQADLAGYPSGTATIKATISAMDSVFLRLSAA